MSTPMSILKQGVSSERSGTDTKSRFTLAKLGKRCWVVGYQGRLIAGAVLTSLPAAAAYAADLAHALGLNNFLPTVVEAGKQGI